MFCGQTDTGHKDDIYQYRSSSPLAAGLLGDKYGTHYEYCVNELTQSFRGEAGGGGGHTSGQYVTRLGSVLDFSKIFDDERKNLGFYKS